MTDTTDTGGKRYSLAINAPQPLNITFTDGSQLIFPLSGKASFTGDVEESARVFFDAVIRHRDSQIEAERQRVAEITEQYVDRTTALSFASQRVEKAEKSNAFLKEELAQQANFNPDWDMLEACRESWREVVALLKEREAELEAERQRAAGSEEELHKALHREKAAERKLLAAQDSIGVLEGVIARKDFDSQKGDQVPVAWTSQRSLETKNKIVAFTDDMSALDYGVANGWTDIVELFTAPQKPVEHPDTRRMDWLCAHCVEVRDPQMYGSHAMFHAQQDSEEWDLPHHTTLREQVDAAIEAASGIVKEAE